MYTLAWGLTHRQLQQDSWSRMDRSLWEGYAHTFFPGGLSLYAVVAGDAAFSGCWRNHLLVARMSGKLSLKTLPRIGCGKEKKKTGWIKKNKSKQWQWREAHSCLGSQIGETLQLLQKSPTWIRISSSGNILVLMFGLTKKKKKRLILIYFSYALLPRQVICYD